MNSTFKNSFINGNSFGLTSKELQEIIQSIEQFSEIEQALIYGSRGMGNYKPTSDIDIAIKGINITYSIQSRLHSILEEETSMPYFFDITNYDTLKNEALKEHIDTKGKTIYIKK